MPRSGRLPGTETKRSQSNSLLTAAERIALANRAKFDEERRREREARKAFGVDGDDPETEEQGG